jgi:gas vesicle protein
MTDMNNQKKKMLVLGAVIGALTGTAAAYLLAERMEEGDQVSLTPKDGVKLGVSVFAFLRQVTDLAKKG